MFKAQCNFCNVKSQHNRLLPKQNPDKQTDPENMFCLCDVWSFDYIALHGVFWLDGISQIPVAKQSSVPQGFDVGIYVVTGAFSILS